MKNYIVTRNNGRDFFEEAFEDFFKPVCFTKSSHNMKTDIKETEKAFEFEIDMPGFKKEEIEISLENGYLTVSAQKNDKEEKDNKNNYIRRERSVSVSRSYYVDDVEKDKIKAKYENGILNIFVPKEEPKQIEQSKITIE